MRSLSELTQCPYLRHLVCSFYMLIPFQFFGAADAAGAAVAALYSPFSCRCCTLCTRVCCLSNICCWCLILSRQCFNSTFCKTLTCDTPLFARSLTCPRLNSFRLVVSQNCLYVFILLDYIPMFYLDIKKDPLRRRRSERACVDILRTASRIT